MSKTQQFIDLCKNDYSIEGRDRAVRYTVKDLENDK